MLKPNPMKHSFACIDAHTCGNPVRVVTTGHPPLDGVNMAEKRLHFLRDFDWIRKALMFEPRGHDMMSGAFIYPATREDCDGAILFIETSGCLPMCGHGSIGTITVGLEQGLLRPSTPGKLRLEVPAGVIDVEYEEQNGRIVSVKLCNVASYLALTDLAVDCPGLGTIKLDVSYGGNFYAIVEPQGDYAGLEHCSVRDILHWSPLIRTAVNKAVSLSHPDDPSINGVHHVMWTGNPQNSDSDAANAVFYGDNAIDRSPCGTGTSARMAQLFARSKLKKGDTFVHESIIGSQFIGAVEDITEVGGHLAIIPSVKGWAQVTGFNTIVVDSNDPYAYGFSLMGADQSCHSTAPA